MNDSMTSRRPSSTSAASLSCLADDRDCGVSIGTDRCATGCSPQRRWGYACPRSRSAPDRACARRSRGRGAANVVVDRQRLHANLAHLDAQIGLRDARRVALNSTVGGHGPLRQGEARPPAVGGNIPADVRHSVGLAAPGRGLPQGVQHQPDRPRVARHAGWTSPGRRAGS